MAPRNSPALAMIYDGRSKQRMPIGPRWPWRGNLTIGMDLGDRATRYCVLDEAGDVILERSVPTTTKGMDQVFAAMPRSRVALETGVHSP